MRHKRAFGRHWPIALFLAGGFGYLIGDWNARSTAPPAASPDVSAAQTVALRFPELKNDPSDGDGAVAGRGLAAEAPIVGRPELALFTPEPMVAAGSASQAAPQTSPQVSAQAAAPSAAIHVAEAEEPAPELPSSARAMAAQAPAKPLRPPLEAKPKLAATHLAANRPGFMLDDAQIASIKERLHLTPDQDRMWPAVEAALRNLAYLKAREARRHGVPASAAQIAAVDPNSAEVQGLKSAAIPLLMSFNAEQKDQVRSLAHVMGLDQLASEF